VIKKILATGKTSRFAKFLKNDFKNFDIKFPSKQSFNILDYKQINKYIKKNKITHIIHIAGLSRPMSLHDKNINKSIDLNIIGTSNVVKSCIKNKVKIIYFSTNYVYEGTKGNYKESDPVKPINNYAWSKLGGECAVQMYKNSLILRLCMTDYPFVHTQALTGAISSFIFNKSVSKILPYLLDVKGILNIGGKRREIFKFAKKYDEKEIKRLPYKKIKNFPKDSSLNIIKFKRILKKKNKLKTLSL